MLLSNIKFLSYIIVRTHENCFRRLVLFKDSYPWTKAGSRPEVCEHVTCKLFMEICPKNCWRFYTLDSPTNISVSTNQRFPSIWIVSYIQFRIKQALNFGVWTELKSGLWNNTAAGSWPCGCFSFKDFFTSYSVRADNVNATKW